MSKMSKPNLTAIVAVDANWGIGAGGDLLFSLPTDMKYFRTVTSGRTVLMGRKTLDSFPGGRPLPKRRNIVLTRSESLPQDVELVHTVEDLVAAAGAEAAFVIGGGELYRATIDQCHTALVTRVAQAGENVDTYFPNLDADEDWEVVSTSDVIEENGCTYTFVEYRNRRVKLA